MKKKERKKALKKVDDQELERKTIPVPKKLWEMILHLSDLMEVDKQARTDRDYDREAVHAQIWAKHGEIRSRLLPHLWLTGRVEKLTPETKEEDEKYTGPGPFEEKTFLLSNDEWKRLRSSAQDADRMNGAIHSLNTTTELLGNFYDKWAADEISDKAFVNKADTLFNRLSRELKDVEGWAKTLCQIFEFLEWIEEGRPGNMPIDAVEEVPF